jgi:hypothetical protein
VKSCDIKELVWGESEPSLLGLSCFGGLVLRRTY